MPAESRLAALSQASFSDAFEAVLDDPALTAAEIAAIALSATPAFVEGLLRLRNVLARPFGVTPVTALSRLQPRPAGAWRPGDRFSIFTIDSVDDDELVLGIDDSHLDVRISFLRRARSEAPTYVIASHVRTHNWVGRVYMLPVGVVHAMLVRWMMGAVGV